MAASLRVASETAWAGGGSGAPSKTLATLRPGAQAAA